MRFLNNNKGAFSIIAALFVAGILITTSVVTYSALRYSPVQDSPQVLSAIDETNLGIKQILSFTVGYYGSVLKVTGNVAYANSSAYNYLINGLGNMSEIHPEWDGLFSIKSLDLKVNWFTNDSFSQGTLTVNYDLNGLGISGISYTASTRLEVEIAKSSSSSQAQLTILGDNDEPLINLGKTNLKFYQYTYGNLSWQLIDPSGVTSFADGTYVIDMPPGSSSDSYGIQVDDTRGIMVVATSFRQFTSSVAWNSTSFDPTVDYVDNNNLDEIGSHSNFAAQQQSPDGTCDTLTEAPTVNSLSYYPLYCNLAGSTTIAQPSGNITADTCANDAQYLHLHSYPSAFSSQTATFGYSNRGLSYQSLTRITGSLFSTGNTGGQVQTISAAIHSTSNSGRNVKVAIYSVSDDRVVASSDAMPIVAKFDGWVTFTCNDPKALLSANTNYVLVAWADNAAVNVCCDGPGQGYSDFSANYGNWPNPDSNLNSDSSNKKYSINCTYTLATQYKAQAELVGTSDLLNWQTLTWALDSSVSAGTASCTYQLYYTGAPSQYPTSGDGYISTSLTTTDALQTQTISTNPNNYRNSTSYWKIQVTAVNTTASQFDLKIDLTQLTTQFTDYVLKLQEQWINLNASNPHQDLCIKTGSFSGELLVVQVWHGGAWQYLTTLAPNYLNNASLVQFIDSPTLTIRFVGFNDATDQAIDTWNVDSVYIKSEQDIHFLVNLNSPNFTIELLQNGTMRWLGQNLQLTTQSFPVPPIPVKSLHVNETIKGVNMAVPFQIEDWASDYQVPLGLTSNTTVFSNRQMFVFLLNSTVSDFTIWWDGSDQAVQTPLAYTDRYFTTDNPAVTQLKGVLSNGLLSLTAEVVKGDPVYHTDIFKVTSTVGSTSSVATFMRINNQNSSYGAGASYVIHHGIVRDIIQQESEWSNGPTNCANVYANIVLTLPAQSDYYTYQLRIMFIQSSRDRTINDVCPIMLSTSLSNVQVQTESNVYAGTPIVQNGTGTYSNSASNTPHHFSQFITSTGKGAGLMYTNKDALRLYCFDSFATGYTGTLDANLNFRQIQLLPVDLLSLPVGFRSGYDVTWQGAVATFDNTVPICSMYDDTTPAGLWILVEYPPTLTVTLQS